MFIVLDGIDGAGKTTQINQLAEWFQSTGHTCVLCKDPGSTELGEQLRAILLGKHETPIHVRAEMMMFTTARTQLVEEIVRPALAEGKVVICDRYIFSTVVYQGHAGQLDPDQIWTVNKIATAGLMPDLTFILDLPADQALARLGDDLDRMESRGIDYFQDVRNGFLSEAKRWSEGVEILDAQQSPEQIQEQIRAKIQLAI